MTPPSTTGTRPSTGVTTSPEPDRTISTELESHIPDPARAGSDSAEPAPDGFGHDESDASASVRIRRMASPIGRIEIVSNGSAITSLTIEREGRLPHDAYPESDDPLLAQAAVQLSEYFAGTRRHFDLPIETGGTPFQRSVWNELSALPWGSVTSYGLIGQATGRPTAGRAVGGAVGANPIPIIVPCHRVLASNSKITGYSAGDGVPTKVWLLDHEGISHA